MDRKKKYQAIIFIAIGVVLFWWVFRGTDFDTILNELDHFTWHWVAISIVINVSSQLIRAWRWKLLLTPMNYKPGFINLLHSFFILIFTNQVIPRGGEIVRLGVVSKYEKIPVAKLLGTAIVERLTDVLILISMFVLLLIWQYQNFIEILNLPQISFREGSGGKILLIAGIVTALVIAGIILYKYTHLFSRFKSKLGEYKQDIRQGISSYKQIENKALYFSLSVLIYVLWLAMLYVLFFAYPPVSKLGFNAALFTFGLSALAFLLPIQAGIGAWHFLIIEALFLFGIDKESGKVFSLVAHASITFIYYLLGAVSFILLPLTNKNSAMDKHK